MYIFILMCQSVNLDWKIAVEKVGCVFGFKTELFVQIANDYFAKSSILDVRQGSEYVSGHWFIAQKQFRKSDKKLLRKTSENLHEKETAQIVFSTLKRKHSLAWKVSKYGVISGPYFPVFSPNTGKYGPEITPYLDTFSRSAGFIEILQRFQLNYSALLNSFFAWRLKHFLSFSSSIRFGCYQCSLYHVLLFLCFVFDQVPTCSHALTTIIVTMPLGTCPWILY